MEKSYNLDSQPNLGSTQTSTQVQSSDNLNPSQSQSQSSHSEQYKDYVELQKILEKNGFETTGCFYYADDLKEPEKNEEIFLYQKVGKLTVITGIKGKDIELREGLSEFMKHFPDSKPVLLGVSLYKGNLPDKYPFGSNLKIIPYKEVVNQSGSMEKKALFFSDYRCYEASTSYHPRVVANVIITGQKDVIKYLSSKGFPRLDWNDNALLRASEDGLFVRQNFAGGKSFHINVIHVGIILLSEQPKSRPVKKSWPTILSQQDL